MTTVVPRYFSDRSQLINLNSEKVFGVEFRFNTDITRYNLIATSHVLVFVLKGEKCIHRDNGDVIVKSGELVFFPKGTYVQSDLKSSDNEFKRLVLFFEDSFLKEFVETVSLNENIHAASDDIISLKITPLMRKAIESLEQYLNKKLNYAEPLLKAKLNEILLNILENDGSDKFISILKKILYSPKIDIRYFMDDNFQKPLSVKEFAKLSCRSVRQFNRDFQKVFNNTPQKWIRNRRLEFAHQLIHNTDLSISDICFESGFKNYSNFIQQFRQRFQITPKKLKAQN